MSDKIGELYLYGEIVSLGWDDSDITAKSFKDDLDVLGEIEELNLYINSPGGSVFEGVAIYNIIKRHKARVSVHIDGLAASIASVIAMAGDAIFMPENSMMMVHNPWTVTWGNANEIRKVADDLDRMRESIMQSYLAKTGEKLVKEQLTALLDEETWLTAQECREYGLCDVVGEAKKMVACVSDAVMKRYKNTPKQLASEQKPINEKKEVDLRQQLVREAEANKKRIQYYLEGLA
ncbi:head maturation protease, ClpP-related [Mechercharimyces sp. CAU 1602]|uniref:head maturation protease, ClpP-related n=1 Tax=Mechercharimyces sp. CAU 1602 TaxID=2973933 RepID=UPI00216213B8|nr:head maturation protease, ClpP-related [Mechercharimyces sp. CAU 1602]MCS1351154.1 Clp protease ClpP [Mechercharimyces sp. CAU 1602]